MGKEAKLGVALIALLLGVFGFMLYKRVKATQDAAAAAASPTEQQPASDAPSEKPKLSSGPRKAAVTQPTTPEPSPGSVPPAAATRTDRYGSRYGENSGSSQTGGSENRYGDRHADRYANTAQQIYGPAQTTESSVDTPATNSGGSSDPFATRYSDPSTNSGLRRTNDASAALLPASATTETTATETTQQPFENTVVTTDTTEPEPSNPLRAVAVEPRTAPESRSPAPRNYDLYGPSPAVEEGSTHSVAASNEPTASRRSPPTADRSPPAAPHNHDLYGPSPAVEESSTHTVAASNEPATGRRTPPTADRSPPPADRYTSGTSGGSGNTNWTPTAPRTPPVAHANPHPTANVSEHRAPRPQPAAPFVRTDTYTIEANETLWSISQKVYGNGGYFKALEEHNKARHPRSDLIKAGDVILTPAVEVLTQKYPSLCPKLQHLPPVGSSTGLTSQRGGGRIYTVEEGDTLFDIARFELGKATRWIEIYELNKHVIGEDFNHLRPGTQLMLPTEPHRDDNFTRRPGASISR